MLGGRLIDSVFARTAEDEAIEEEGYHRHRAARLRQPSYEQGEEAAADEEDYVERSRRFQRDAKDRVPFIRGPREDDNPIIDYIIKKRKLESSGERVRSQKINTLALQHAIQDAQIHNRTADERQIEGARANLRGLLPESAPIAEHEVRLLTTMLNSGDAGSAGRSTEPCNDDHPTPSAPREQASSGPGGQRVAAQADPRLLSISLRQVHEHNRRNDEQRVTSRLQAGTAHRVQGISALADTLRTDGADALVRHDLDAPEEEAPAGAEPAPAAEPKCARPRVDTRLLAASLRHASEHNRKEDERQLDGARANLRELGLPDEDAMLLTALLNPTAGDHDSQSDAASPGLEKE